MQFDHAQFEDGTLSVEAGLMEMADAPSWPRG
jgi:hypothetical protein